MRSQVPLNQIAPSIDHRRHRQHRLWFLRLIGLTARLSLLLLSLTGIGALLLVQAPEPTQHLQDWLVDRITRRPKALLNAAEQAMAKEDYVAAADAARQFMASIPLPLPVDTFGESYRRALGILRECAEQTKDVSAQLTAGKMAMNFDPRDTAALFAYAKALQISGDLTQAASVLGAAFAIRPFSNQVATALASLHTAAGEPGKAAQVRARHLEAIALCLNEKGWLRGDIVYSGAGQNSAQGIQLEFPRVTELRLTLAHEADSVYLVIPGLPNLRVIVESAQLNVPNKDSQPIRINPQQALTQLDEYTATSSNPPADSFDAPWVLNLVLPAKPAPTGSTVHLQIRIEPDAELEPWVRLYGTWQHPHVSIASKMKN